MNYTRFTKNIKRFLFEKDLTQAQVAEILGITSVSFNQKITGKTEFTISQAQKMKKIFGTSTLDEIFLDT